MKYGYYPGCSLERNASAYHQSTMAVADRLGVQFAEIDDWNCCGATEYIAVNQRAAYALVGRNLALAADQLGGNGHRTPAPKSARGGNSVLPLDTGGVQLVAPCSACFLNLSKVNRYMADSPDLAQQTNAALAAGGLNYTPNSVQVRHLLDVVVNDVGYEQIAAQVKHPLRGLRVASYYGCLVVRPGFQGSFDDPEYPTTLDKLMRVLGARVIDFPLKAHCCGGHMTQISQDVALDLIRRLLKNANEYDADVIVTLCPMCQLNLDAFQEAVNRRFNTNYNIPVLFFTQMIGLAFGMQPAELGIGKEFVAARPALAKIGVDAPAPAAHTDNEEASEPASGSHPAKPAPRKRRSDDKSLPMPRMPEEEQP
jgi:heterodisulfide reductase subunit B